MTHSASAALQIIRSRGVREPVSAAIILGTGLGALADEAQNAIAIPFADLPGFPRSGVSGHAGRLIIGDVAGARVALLQGRAHYYEHGDARAMAAPLDALAALGVQTLLLTNASGGLREDWPPGTLVALSDHINYAGVNPLIGVASDKRFVSLTDAYDQRLRARMRHAAKTAGVPLQEGVYMWFSGPSFETPAEIRMARILGADLVGMSTVPEVILARHLGLRVAAISLVTNYGAGMMGSSPSHGETKEVAAQGGEALKRLIREFLRTPDDT
jgi:purine-nucleoside phosphorylase